MARHGGRVAAIILEPVLTAGGVIAGEPAFLEAARETVRPPRRAARPRRDGRSASRGGWRSGHARHPARSDDHGEDHRRRPPGRRGRRPRRRARRVQPAAPGLVHSGTFNGNALTLAAGCASLDALPADEVRLNALGESGSRRIREILPETVTVTSAGSRHVHFDTGPVIRSYKDTNMGSETLARFHLAALAEGVYLASRGLLNLSDRDGRQSDRQRDRRQARAGQARLQSRDAGPERPPERHDGARPRSQHPLRAGADRPDDAKPLPDAPLHDFGSEQPGAQAALRRSRPRAAGPSSTRSTARSTRSRTTRRSCPPVWDERDVRNLAALADQAHEHGALAGVELWFGGAHTTGCAAASPAGPRLRFRARRSGGRPPTRSTGTRSASSRASTSPRPGGRAPPASTSSTSTGRRRAGSAALPDALVQQRQVRRTGRRTGPASGGRRSSSFGRPSGTTARSPPASRSTRSTTRTRASA